MPRRTRRTIAIEIVYNPDGTTIEEIRQELSSCLRENGEVETWEFLKVKS